MHDFEPKFQPPLPPFPPKNVIKVADPNNDAENS